MDDLLIRRRDLVIAGAAPTPTPTPVYELSSAVSSTSYDTDWQPFNTAKDFTILCEANFANRNWSSPYTQSLFGISTTASFRVGRAYSSSSVTIFSYYENGVSTGDNKSPYTAVICNNVSEDSDVGKCHAVASRMADTSKHIVRLAVRFTASSKLVECFTDQYEGGGAPSSYWWNLSQNITSSNTLKLNIGTGTSSTINILRAYEALLTDAQINAFLGGS